MLDHCPHLTEAQWVGQAGPRVAQHISGRAQLEALSSAILGLGKECEKKGSPPVTMSCPGGLVGRLGHSGLEPGLLCV